MIDHSSNVSRAKLIAWRASEYVRRHLPNLPAWPGNAALRVRGFNDPFSDTGAPALEHVKDACWQLAENEVRFRELVDSQDELIVRRDSEGRVIFANRAYCDAFAVDLGTIRGRRFHPGVISAEIYAMGSDAHNRIAELVETDKGHRWVLWEEQRIAGSSGPQDIQSIGRDVTDERRAAAELRDARDQAQSANRAKSRFLAAMSHEIRTPMNGILGMAGLLDQTQQSDEQRCYTRAIDQSARALLALIDEILDFSKIEAGKLKLMPEAFSLRECVASAIELLEHKAADKGLALTCTFAADVANVVMGDHSRVRQIVLNLVSNAVKFTDQGRVEVVVRRRASAHNTNQIQHYEIVVADTGIGFSPETLKLLFDEFEQADGPIERRQNGTGLGLAISKRLARAMGGDILAEGVLGKGATFTASLRLGTVADDAVAVHRASLAMAASVSKESAIAVPVSVAAPRILIAEDNEINALLTRRVSERSGCSVVVATNGRRAVDAVERAMAAQEPGFDIILMDVFMPEMDGLQATTEIQRLFSARDGGLAACPPIIALTANAFAEDRERCLAAGMDDYLAKPFDAGQLVGLLARWVPRLDRRRPGQRDRRRREHNTSA